MRGKKAGVVAGYLALVLQNAISFFLTPFMLRVLGDSEFGVYRLMLSIGAFFALADLGLSNAVVRYVSEYRAKNDKESEGRFVALIVLVDLLAGLVIVLAGFVLWLLVPGMFRDSFAVGEVQLLRRLIVFLVASGVLTLFLNLTSGVMKSYNEFGTVRAFEIARSVFRAGSVVVLLLMGYKVYAVVLADTLILTATLVITAVYAAWKLGIRPHFRDVTISYGREILSYSIIVFVDALAFQLFNSADTVIIGMRISSSAVAVYSIGVLISSLFFALSVVISDVLMPEVVEQVALGAEGDQLTDYMVKIGRIKLLVLALPTIGFAFLGQRFVTLWVGEGYSAAFYVALIVVIPSMLSGLSDVGLHIMWAKKKHKVKSAASLAIAVTNVVLTVVLVRFVGILGAAIGTSVAWVGYILFNGVYFSRVLALDMRRFYRETFKGVWIAMAGTAALAALAGSFGEVTWLTLAVQVVGVTAAYVGIAWALALNSAEKALLGGMLRTS